MSLSFTNAVVAGLRHNGVVVHFWDGYAKRGNGQTSAYEGLIVHHTVSAFGSAYPLLVNGRAGLSGPLCNSSGNDDGSVTIIAANPANHAGASGGRSMGPLPVTRSFNKHVWGHEIVYPGTVPMRDAQYKTAQILSAVISGILKRPTAEWVRAHAETSITGKFDPGYAPGKTYDMAAFRRGVFPTVNSVAPITKGDDNMVTNHLVSGNGSLRLICPVGKVSGVTARAWISGVTNGPAPGSFRVWYQTDTGGIRDKAFLVTFKNGLSTRPWDEVPDGTTQINVQYSFPNGGTICLETAGK